MILHTEQETSSYNLQNLSQIPELSGTVLVAGAGVSGVGMAELLSSLDIDVVVADGNAASRQAIAQQLGVVTLSPEDAMGMLSSFSLVVTSPGWRPDTPLLVAAQEAGLSVIGDVELCFRLDRAGVFGSPRTWIGITGTNGKTTTTAMLTQMLQGAGKAAASVGNIGIAVSEALLAIPRIDILCVELSSFQLHWSEQLIPDIGILLNLANDHLDWHGSFAAYAEAKAKVLRAPIAIAGIDNEAVRREITRLGADVVGFTLTPPEPSEVGVEGGTIIDRAFGTLEEIAEGTVVASLEGIEPSGPAGALDALAATAAARALQLEPADISHALAQFKVAGHRGQIVKRWHKSTANEYSSEIVAVDNSKATNPHAADSALAGFPRVVWIAGGQLKGADVEPLVEKYASMLSAVALIGEDRSLIAEAVRKYAPGVAILESAETDPEKAMDEVVSWAVERAVPGDAIVLAPAAASLDMYSGMGERGTMFAAAIEKFS